MNHHVLRFILTQNLKYFSACTYFCDVPNHHHAYFVCPRPRSPELVLLDFVCLGAAIATITRWVANTFLKPPTSLAFAVDQDVEWAFAFDIHCNGFLPVFVALHAAQFVLYPLLRHERGSRAGQSITGTTNTTQRIILKSSTHFLLWVDHVFNQN
jgi:hypothetical protein